MSKQDQERPAEQAAKLLAGAREQLALGNLDEARRQVDAYIGLKPDQHVGFSQRAAIAQRSGDLRGAIEDTRRALDLTQGQRVPYAVGLARLLLADGQPEEAQAVLDAALARVGDKAALLAQGIRHAATTGELELADSYGERYLAVYLDDPDASPQHLVDYAHVKRDHLQTEAALDIVELGLKQWPTAVQLLLSKANITASIGLKATARDLLREKVLPHPDLDPILKARAQDRLAFLEGRAYLSGTGKTVLIEPPPAEDDFARQMNSDSMQDVFVRRSPGARKLLFVFNGLANEAGGVPATVLDAMLRRMPLHVVYLRDFQRLLYLKGIPELGADLPATVAGLRALQHDLGATSVFCMGNSAGGYGAIVYGTALEADTVLGLSTATTTELVVRKFDARGAGLGRRLQAEVPHLLGNLRTQLENAPRPPRLLLHFGAEMRPDRAHAENLAGLPGVHLFPAPGFDKHDITGHLYAEGRLEQVLRETIREERPG